MPVDAAKLDRLSVQADDPVLYINFAYPHMIRDGLMRGPKHQCIKIWLSFPPHQKIYDE